jgi:hypothetical protein
MTKLKEEASIVVVRPLREKYHLEWLGVNGHEGGVELRRNWLH